MTVFKEKTYASILDRITGGRSGADMLLGAFGKSKEDLRGYLERLPEGIREKALRRLEGAEEEETPREQGPYATGPSEIPLAGPPVITVRRIDGLSDLNEINGRR